MKQWILNVVMGLALLVGGGWLAVYEQQHPPVHSGHLYVGIGLALLGALLINPTPIINSVKQVVIVIAPIIPWSKAGQSRRTSGAVTPPDDPEPRP
jgi:predicted Co/Zn/Cd cation transporter (cation efflux family)